MFCLVFVLTFGATQEPIVHPVCPDYSLRDCLLHFMNELNDYDDDDDDDVFLHYIIVFKMY